MVHGFRGDHHGLEAIALAMVRIDPTCHVVIADLPGFGESFVQSTDELSLAFFAGCDNIALASDSGNLFDTA